MSYLIVKSLHIIFVITWFSGLFYIWRLFVYHAEAAKKNEPDRSILLKQYAIMERRLWYMITWPSCLLTLLWGTWLIVLNPDLLSRPWMQAKLFFVALLLLYQLYGQKIFRMLQSQPDRYHSFFLRLMNEVSTLILIAVIFLVVNQDAVSWMWGIAGLVGIGAILMLVVRLYKKHREKTE